LSVYLNIMSICYIPISIGELFDKYSILLIKLEKITNTDKLIYINKELELLKQIIKRYNIDENLFNNLLNINKNLWEIEDDIRKKEHYKEFDKDFIELARNVYKYNDIRAEIKKQINILFNSEIIEIKDYNNYN
jgi:hypothetical protein